ncbi:MAG: DUF2953 domain-containing protein [Ruminococcaceae bacterium]|nr:DUF2953 domain-containing protein [Oscillospiraceae bacterium]
MGWWIALGILALIFSLGFIPLKVRLRYSKAGFKTEASFASFKVLDEDDDKDKQLVSKIGDAAIKKGGSLKTLLSIFKIALEFFGELRRKIRVKRLELQVTAAGDSPYDAAVHYGQAWVAVGLLMSPLEQLFTIKKRNIQVGCDFEAEDTKVYFRADITITLWRLLSLIAKYGWRAIKAIIKTNDNKGGAENE